MNTNLSKTTPLRPGWVSVLGILTLSIVLLLILTSAYRFASQSQNIQKRNQLYIDYTQREQAVLRAVLTLSPNAAIKGMMSNSFDTNNSLNSETLWEEVFNDALDLADSEIAISADEMNSLGIPASSISGNVADGNYGHSRSVISPVNFSTLSSGFLLIPGVNDFEQFLGLMNHPAYPESLTVVNSDAFSRDLYSPVITTEKYYGSPETQFQVLPYPNVHFGYTGQGQNFVAKRNWWAFSIHMGNEDGGSSGFRTKPKNYVLSIYEVPSQLAMGSTALTNFGQHSDGTDWANISISGGAFAAKAETRGSVSLTRLSSREGITLTGNSSVGGIGAGGVIPTRETFEATNADFFPLTTSADSGLVAFIPINAGDDAYDNISNIQDDDYTSSGDNRVSPTSWSWYSRPAAQCVMKLKVTEVTALDDQTPISFTFSYLAGGLEETETYTRGVPDPINPGDPNPWPTSSSAEGADFPFHTETTPDGRIALTVYVDRIENFLTTLGADNLTVNSSIAVSADYLTGTNVVQPSIPSLETDIALIARGTSDFTQFAEGFSLVTPFRLYLADDVNITPYTAGGSDFPPLSLFTPEKRFGARRSAMEIQFEGQINHLTKDSTAINPLDLRSGTDDSVVPSNIRANLFSISDPSELPPINQMNWLVVIEEVQ